MIEERFDRIDATLLMLGEHLVAMNGRFDAIDGRLDKIDARQDAMDGRLDKIDARLDAVDARLDGMDARLDSIDTRLNEMDARFDVLESAVQRLSVKQDAMSEEFLLFKEGLAANNERLDRFEERVDRRFDELTVDIRLVLTDHHRRIGALEQRH